MNKPEQSLEEYVSGLPENEFRCWWELHGEPFKEFAVQVLENGGDGPISHVRIGNRFGFKIVPLERLRELFWPHGPDDPVPLEKMGRIIDAEIGGGN